MRVSPRTRGRRTTTVAAATMCLLLGATVSMAQEIGTGLEEATKEVGKAAQSVTGGSSASTIAEAPPVPSTPTSDDDSEGHETQDPAPPDHAGGSVLDVNVAGEDALTVGETESRIRDNGESSGDVTVLAIGGSEIVGAHSNSRSGPESDSNHAFGALCEESDGGVCVGLLFADTTSTEDGTRSSSDSRAALAFLCLGGEQTEADGTCNGVLGVGAATSESDITRNERTGRTDASQETELADVCVGGEGREGVCEGLGIALLHSESASSALSEDENGTTDRSSFLAVIEDQGEEEVIIDEPTALAIPPGCPAGESLLCIFLNQGESFVFVGGAGSRQEVVHVSLLPGVIEGQDLVEVHAGVAETLARNAGPAEVLPETEVRPEARGAPQVEGEVAGELAFTGADLLAMVLLALALSVIGVGALILARRRVA
jgi:hypothetical protein